MSRYSFSSRIINSDLLLHITLQKLVMKESKAAHISRETKVM